METQTPLFLVILVIAALWLLGKILAKASSNTHVDQPASQRKKQSPVSGNEIAPGLHVNGLSDHLLRQMNDIIEQGDAKKLAYFFTKRCPEFTELDEYFSELRSQFFTALGKPSNVATEEEKIEAIEELDIHDAPDFVDLDVISKTELRSLIEDDVKSFRVITDELMGKFDGENFYENFQAYAQLGETPPVTLHIPPDHPHRKQLESLVETGVAIKGRKIPLKDRLNVLKFSQLRDIATELKINSEFKRKADATEALAAMPGSAVHLAMVYDISDIFYLKDIAVNVQAVEDEWTFFNAYAKLIIETLTPI